MKLLIACSRWQGGQVWVAHPDGSVFLDAYLHAVQLPFLTLEPHVAHATLPCSGDRSLWRITQKAWTDLHLTKFSAWTGQASTL